MTGANTAVGAYVLICVVIVILYRRYLENSEKRTQLNADEIFAHIEQVVEQKLLEAAVAQQVANQ